MINGAHVIVYSKDAEADKAFIKNVLKFKYVDVHKGWLIFKLPPSEVAVHPSDEKDMHGFFLMTGDFDSEIAAPEKPPPRCEKPPNKPWGGRPPSKFPGAGSSGLFQPPPRR